MYIRLKRTMAGDPVNGELPNHHHVYTMIDPVPPKPTMKLIISQGVRAKLAAKSPPVSEEDIVQCFANRTGKSLTDTRANNLTNPLTRWFIAQTDFGQVLKICYVPTEAGIHIKSAYAPNAEEVRIYRKYGEKS